MSPTPSPVLRALEGLSDYAGRTVVISGPPMSGKSAMLAEIRATLAERSARIVELRGSYRARSIPYGALDGLSQGFATMNGEGSPSGDLDTPDLGSVPDVPMAPIPYLADRLPSSRRSRADRGRTTFLGQPVRSRSANEGDPEAYWQQLLPQFRAPDYRSVALLIEDGALFDPDSREFVVALSRKARLRPLLIVCALDTSVPGYMSWEDSFLGRGDVDWVRLPQSAPDAREAHRLKGIFDDLPSVSQRMVGYVALLGGNVGEVVLSRVARLSYTQLAEALLPATGVGLIKVQDGKVLIPHLAWISLTADLIPGKQLSEMHLEIANALAALSPEPSLARRIEVARHYLAWFPGPMALKHLLEAGELSLHLLAYDSAEELFAEAIGCLPALPAGERGSAEAELRLLHAQSLFCAGRPAEAEAQMTEGFARALQAKVSADVVAEWMEALVLIMRVVGPRPSLVQSLMELADRAHDARMLEIEILVQSLLAEFYWERTQDEKSREESRRSGALAQTLPAGHLQATALVSVGLARIEGTAEEQELAGRFLRTARTLLGRARRWEFDHLVGDLEARLLEAQGDWAKALQQREQAVASLQRQRLPNVEIYHQLAIAAILFDHRNAKGVEAALERARAIAENLHLLPPSPCLLRLLLLEGRYRALNGETGAARDRWEAIVESPTGEMLPRVRAETLVRLALLEYTNGRTEVADSYVALVGNPEVRRGLPPGWAAMMGNLAAIANASHHGGDVLPPARPSTGRRDGQSRERARR